MNKSKKIIAVVVTVVMALLLTAMILLLCLHPNKNNNTSGSDDDTTQTPGDNTGNNGGSSDNNEGNSGSDNSGSTGNPSDSQTPAEDYAFDTPSAIILSADKTELTAGDTFTLTVEIATNRTDLYWQAIDVVIGPMSNETTFSTDIASNFELVKYSVNDGFKGRDWIDSSSDQFNEGLFIGCFRFSVAYIGSTPPLTTQKLVLTAQIKVKDTATAVDSFSFGFIQTDNNMLYYISQDYITEIYDYANGITKTKELRTEPKILENSGITTKPLTMSIKAKSN